MNKLVKIAPIFTFCFMALRVFAGPENGTATEVAQAGSTDSSTTSGSMKKSPSKKAMIRQKSSELRGRVANAVQVVPETGDHIAQHLSQSARDAWQGVQIQNASPADLVAMIRAIGPEDVECNNAQLRLELFNQLKTNRSKLLVKSSVIMVGALIVGGAAYLWSPGSSPFFQNTVVPISSIIFGWGGKQAGTAAKTWFDEHRLKHS